MRGYFTPVSPYARTRLMETQLLTVAHLQTRCSCHVWMGEKGMLARKMGMNWDSRVLSATRDTKGASRRRREERRPAKTLFGGAMAREGIAGWGWGARQRRRQGSSVTAPVGAAMRKVPEV